MLGREKEKVNKIYLTSKEIAMYEKLIYKVESSRCAAEARVYSRHLKALIRLGEQRERAHEQERGEGLCDRG